jgi:hypothetical protein
VPEPDAGVVDLEKERPMFSATGKEPTLGGRNNTMKPAPVARASQQSDRQPDGARKRAAIRSIPSAGITSSNGNTGGSM